MDIFNALSLGSSDQDTAFQKMIKIKVVDMHTSGEPTRIIISGYPALQGRTLLEKRAYARTPSWDGTRKWLMREPRGHAEMYGAILIAETELTQSGDADIGVLFCHNDGYSTMCGHATLALGRFLVDTQDEDVFPRRKSLIPSTRTGFVFLRIHAPCGVIQVEVPITPKGRSDPSKPVEFLGVPSFVGGMDVMVDILSDDRWKMFSASGRTSVRLDVAYGGAFYAIVDAHELGFTETLLAYPVSELAEAAKVIKALVGKKSELLAHPIHHDLEFLYGVIITEKQVGKDNWEGGICFFANNQIDRSPTGSVNNRGVFYTLLGVNYGTRMQSLRQDTGQYTVAELFSKDKVWTKDGADASPPNKANNPDDTVDTVRLSQDGRFQLR
ncbi:hypothetical protein ONZ45_g9762 [Pleurotus djamor]|nr:hypothetical protein ONZ45_g9762 [Pleurotus djamor]